MTNFVWYQNPPKTSFFQVNPDLAKKIKDWNNADFQLYDHFNKTFWRRVDAFGRERMDAELESFRAEQKKAEELCIESYQVNWSTLSKWSI